MPNISPDQRTAILKTLKASLQNLYTFPDVAEKVCEYLDEQAAASAYDDISDADAFASQLTTDLQSVTHDKHMRVSYQPKTFQRLKARHDNPDDDSGERNMQASLRYINYGFEKVERLTGNIGYIRFDMFADASVAGSTAIAALQFVAHCDAIIFDVRKNGGGSPSMVQLISSYLFDEPKHLNTFYWRPDDSYQQFWTQAHVQGQKMVDTPVYILTSSTTFSAAEEFTYNLKNMERATIIGETTGGGAHPGGSELLVDDFLVWMPQGRPINPISETNWEGTGIAPHVNVSASEALETAHLHALESILENIDDDEKRATLEWELATVRAEYHPADLSAVNLEEYAGAYGQMTILEADGHLLVRDQFSTRPLVPLSETLFMDTLINMHRLEFALGETAVLRIHRRGRGHVTEVARERAVV